MVKLKLNEIIISLRISRTKTRRTNTNNNDYSKINQQYVYNCHANEDWNFEKKFMEVLKINPIVKRFKSRRFYTSKI
jgi:hypothetical protein